MDYKKVEVSLKTRYRSLVELGFITTLSVFILMGIAYPRFRLEKTIFTPPKIEIDVEKIDITQQLELPPPPARPSVPVESESEDLIDDVTIDPTTIDQFSMIEPPPPPEPANAIEFIPYDEAPVPIGGYAAIQKKARYPEIAQEAGIEGIVIVRAFINDKGIVERVSVMKGVPNTGLDEAAMEAVKKTRFKPAKQRDKAVGVYISIPVTFRLTER